MQEGDILQAGVELTVEGPACVCITVPVCVIWCFMCVFYWWTRVCQPMYLSASCVVCVFSCECQHMCILCVDVYVYLVCLSFYMCCLSLSVADVSLCGTLWYI